MFQSIYSAKELAQVLVGPQTTFFSSELFSQFYSLQNASTKEYQSTFIRAHNSTVLWHCYPAIRKQEIISICVR